ncbi:nuclear transport factor 2 family protein [Pedobacter cryoconitis]|uniref:Ketosteroid isomerase-like protein n=1 Tax=Pedobacter cryoconitis TaxID=188932 RepID=A0A327SI58_9SPHI|nr:nuclear transport factor 2 family protein [Pedobacter cryoconitis]RAJ28806.1 ketosteroid isomerase-like protein [Pedobacter cryoconitis]
MVAKHVILVFLTTFTLISCHSANHKNMEPINNEKLVRVYFEHFNKHDWVKMADIYAETALFKDPSLGKGVVTQKREQTVKKYSELSQQFPDVKDSILNIYPSGDKNIIVEFVSSGTAPDNSKFELPICTIFTIENGLITKDFTYYDNSQE